MITDTRGHLSPRQAHLFSVAGSGLDRGLRS
jgi:hypothetical protein